jgi:glycopeptide antibiotics resistance protein
MVVIKKYWTTKRYQSENYNAFSKILDFINGLAFFQILGNYPPDRLRIPLGIGTRTTNQGINRLWK